MGIMDLEEENRKERARNSLLLIKKLKARVEELERERTRHEPVAIVGLSCRFPGAPDPEAFWKVLSEGVDAIGEVPPDRWDKDAFYDPDPETPGKIRTLAGGFIEGVDGFDPAFFGISPREASSMDPQHRLLLEVSWEALERAGIAPLGLLGSRTGVFVGISTNEYAYLLAAEGVEHLDTYFSVGSALSAAPGRVSYTLGLQGPSIAIDTACSSSLVALHQAARSLLDGECDLALAGGVSLVLSPLVSVNLSKARILSPDGRCKTFDAAANGYVRGEGCGVVVLKRLGDAERDGDRILAVLRGSAVNQDGRSAGLMVPNGPSQEAVVREALRRASLAPSDVVYVEAHGTGTALGDPIEVGALGAVLGQGRQKDEPLFIGSVKTNIGHLEAAAGIAGVIKVVLSLQHDVIPPHLHFRQPSPFIPWDRLPVRVSSAATPWPVGRKRIAGVSSFGFIGTNAHLVLEEPPARPSPEPASTAAPQERSTHLLTLSARTRPALCALAERTSRWLADHPGEALGDVAFTANTGRSHFAFRAAVVARSREEVQSQLSILAAGGVGAAPQLFTGEARQTTPKVAFLFTGHGPQYTGMARELYETEPVFREVIDRCAGWGHGVLDRPLTEILFGEDIPIHQAAYAQPALFALEVALAALWKSFGIVPDIVLGHSTGEYAAAVVAGALSLEDGFRLIARRGALMQALPEGGTMAAVLAAPQRVEALVSAHPGLSIAAYNGANTVISGPVELVKRAVAPLEAEGLEHRMITASHAFHSAMLEPMLDAFERSAQASTPHVPQLPLVSNLTGQRLEAGQLLDASYWRRHAREPVRFAEGVRALAGFGAEVLVEVGPAPMLLEMARRCWPGERPPPILVHSLRRDASDGGELAAGLARLYVSGVLPDFAGYAGPFPRRKLTLPTYPFQRRRFWPERVAKHASPRDRTERPRGLLGVRTVSAASGETVYSTLFGRSAQPFLDEHRVLGRVVVPGATYAAMALSAVGTPCRLSNVLFLEPLGLDEDELRQVQLVLAPVASDGRRAFQVYSEGQGGWVRHAQGVVEPPPRAVGEGEGRTSLEALQGRLAIRDPAELYGRYATSGITLGPCFRGIHRLWAAPGEALAEVRVPAELDTSREEGLIHPAVLDACTGVAGAVVGEVPGASALYVPWQYEEVELRAPLPPRVYCHARLREAPPGGNGETGTFNLTFLGESGEHLGAIQGFVVKRASHATFAPGARLDVDDWLYELSWQERAGHVATRSQRLPGRWLILGQGRLARRLLARCEDGVLVESAETFDFAALAATGTPLQGVIHTAALDGSGDTPGSLTGLEPEARGLCTSVLLLLQALARHGMRPPGGLWLLTRGAQATGPEARLSLAQSSLTGLGRVIRLEHPELRCRHVDLAPDGESEDAELESLLSEFHSPTGEVELAWRDGNWRVPRLSRLRRTEQPALPPLQANASYLITGGLGSLGLETARWMFARGARHLALMGRRPPGPAAETILRELREAGCEVLTLAVDVSREQDLKQGLETLDATLPPLRGIVHAAVVLDDGVLLNQSQARFATVFGPKVAGALLLHQLTAERTLDFFVLFSSTASLFGSPGQGNYASANAVLDALAHHRRRAGLPALSINWGGWGRIGLAARPDIEGRLGAQGVGMIGVEQGFAAFERLLASGATQAAAIPVDWEAFGRQFQAGESPPLLKGLLATEMTRQSLRERLVEALPQERLSLLQAGLVEALARVLRLDPREALDPQQDFFAMGMDSLTAIELRNRLRQELTGQPGGLPAGALSPAVIFENRSVASLTEFLAQKLGFTQAGADKDTPRSKDWSAELSLPAEIGTTGPREPSPRPRTILLTGASGFLGAFLLHELLRRTEARILCLIRGADAAACLERIRQNQRAYGLETERLDGRVEALPGDFTQPRFGLSEKDYARLEDQVELILHNGAEVNFLHSYEWLRPANVLGTLEVLRLASRGRLKPVHHVSTIAAFPVERGQVAESDIPSELDMLGAYGGITLAAGYCQTKAVAELLVRQAGARGLPVTIYRPGFICGSSQTGAWSTQDLAARLFKSWAEFGACAIERLNLAPVDYVSQAIVQLLTQGDTAGDTFHLTHPHSLSGGELVELFRSSGQTLVQLSYDRFRARLEHRVSETGDKALAGLLEVMPSEEIPLFKKPLEVDCQRTQEVLARGGIACPPVDERLFARYLHHFRTIGFISAA